MEGYPGYATVPTSEKTILPASHVKSSHVLSASDSNPTVEVSICGETPRNGSHCNLRPSRYLIKGGCTYHNALYHNGRFHVVDGFRRVSTLCYDDGQLTELARVVVTRAPPFIGREEKCYLVRRVTDGDLLLVVRNYMSTRRRTGFGVFKLMAGRGGSSIEPKGLGNWVLFLGLNRAIPMMAESDDGGVFGGNCVCFLDDGLNTMGGCCWYLS